MYTFQRQGCMQKYGRIDALVSNAVVNPTAGPLLDTPEAAIDKILDVNIKAALLLTGLAAPYMPSGSSVLYVTSVCPPSDFISPIYR